MKIWYTSDTHFGHKNILKYCKRPFRDVQEHDEMLITYWNQTVAPEDYVYHLGDFQFNSDAERYLPRLNGNKILIRGNHDFQHPKIMESQHWKSVHDVLEIRDDKTKIVLCHYAMRVWPNGHRGSLMLYGHSHGRLSGNTQSYDVGVDAWNYRPVSLKDIRKRLKTFTPYIDPSFHDEHPNVLP